jgi:hypothetical protein
MTTRTKVQRELIEKEFEEELDIFRKEASAATQFFYSWLAVHATLGEYSQVLNTLNKAPLFWATALGALQQSTFIVLGRIFDRDPRSHGVYKLLRLAQNNPEMFHKDALGERKQRASANASEWLADYLHSKHDLTRADFRRLRAHTNKWHRVYKQAYEPIRNRVFAHNEITSPEARAQLFAKTNVREIQRLMMFLRQLHEGLWEFFNNGYKPILRPQRYSLSGIRASAPRNPRDDVQERITIEAEQFLLDAAAVPSPKRFDGSR